MDNKSKEERRVSRTPEILKDCAKPHCQGMRPGPVRNNLVDERTLVGDGLQQFRSFKTKLDLPKEIVLQTMYIQLLQNFVPVLLTARFMSFSVSDLPSRPSSKRFWNARCTPSILNRSCRLPNHLHSNRIKCPASKGWDGRDRKTRQNQMCSNCSAILLFHFRLSFGNLQYSL
jgi:hypothetical protein